MTKVSFVLPAYKRRFLKEAIASILAQTYRDFELVVVDDCSPEDLKSVVDEFRDDRLSYFRNEVNLGGKNLIAAWNVALEKARGEFVICAGDDDVYAAGYLEEMLRLAEKYPAVDLFHCRIACIDGQGAWKWVSQPRAEFESGIEMIYHRGVLRMEQRLQEFMFRRKPFIASGGFVDTPQAMYTDDATWMRFSQEHGVVCSSKILFSWRASGLNISERLDNPSSKLAAASCFRKWIWALIGELEPKTEQDRQILGLIKSGIDGAIWGFINWCMNHSDFMSWCRAIVTADLPLRDRLRLIKARLRMILGF